METTVAQDARPITTSYRPGRPVSLPLTLGPLGRGRHDPTMVWDAAGVWRTLQTPEGPATLRLDGRADGVDAAAWGDGAEWAIRQVPELLGEGDEPGDFDVSGHPLLRDAARRLAGLRLCRVGVVLEVLIAAILEQKVTGVEARRAWRVLVRKHGEPAPGPAPAGMRVAPRAAAWRRIPSWEWHGAGVGPQRSATAVAAASVAPGLQRTVALGRGGEEVLRRLRAVPGVGAWTAAETSQRVHGDPDAVSVGDYHLPALVGWALIGRPVDDDGMLELLDPWRGQRQRVMRLIEQSGFAKPRFGSRLTVQDHRGH